MDETGRVQRFWLRPLGAFLLVLGALLLCPWVRPDAQQTAELGPVLSTGYLAFGVLPLIAGLLALLAFRGPLGRRSSLTLFWLAWATAIAPRIPILAQLFYERSSSSGRSLILFGVGADLLGTGAAAALWGDAILLREHPGSVTLQQRARVAAGLVQLAFLLGFVSQVTSIASFRAAPSGAGATVYPISQLAGVAERVLLLWSSILAVRQAPGIDVVQERARRMVRIMGFWWVALAASQALTLLAVHLQESQTRTLGSASSQYLLIALEVAATGAAAAAWAGRPPKPRPAAAKPAPSLEENPPPPAA